MSSHYWIIKLPLIFLYSSPTAFYVTLLCVMRSLIRINCTPAAAVYQPRHSVARISWWGAFGIYLEVEWLKLWKFTFETREILCHGCVRICDVKCRFSGDFQMIFGEWLYPRIDSQICHQMRIFGTVRGNRLNLLSEYWGFTNLRIFIISGFLFFARVVEVTKHSIRHKFIQIPRIFKSIHLGCCWQVPQLVTDKVSADDKCYMPFDRSTGSLGGVLL